MQPNREFTELGLPQKWHRRLERRGIHTVADLCGKMEKELRVDRLIGPKTIQAIKEALDAKGLSLADAPEKQAVNCICPGRPKMDFLMANRGGEFWECSACSRLLYRSRVTPVQSWYRVEGLMPDGIPEVSKRHCQTCQAETIHICKPDGSWLCLPCRVRVK